MYGSIHSPPFGIAETEKLNNLEIILDVYKLSKTCSITGDLSLFFNHFQENHIDEKNVLPKPKSIYYSWNDYNFLIFI